MEGEVNMEGWGTGLKKVSKMMGHWCAHTQTWIETNYNVMGSRGEADKHGRMKGRNE